MKTARTACFLLAIALFLASAGPLPGASGLDSRIAQEEARMRILEKQISEHQKRAKQMGEKEKGVLTSSSPWTRRRR